MVRGWKQFGIQYISLTPQTYVNSLQWQIGRRKLTPTRLALALSENSHARVSAGTAKIILRKYPPKRSWRPALRRRR